MNEKTCPKYQKCPIFSGEGLKREQSKDVYRNLFCEAGKEKFSLCKRFIVSEKTGNPVPPNILPNSTYSIDEIIEMIDKN